MRRFLLLFLVVAAVFGGFLLFVTVLAAPATMPLLAPAGDGIWEPLGGPIMAGGQVNAVATLPTVEGTAFAAVAPAGAYDAGPSTIYKTTDGGGSWSPGFVAGRQVYALAAQGTQLYAGAFNPGGEPGPVLYASGDGGVNWAPVFSTTTRWVMLDVAVNAGDDQTALAAGWRFNEPAGIDEGVVYGTADGGLSWSPLLTATVPGQNSTVNALLSHPITQSLVFAAARLGDAGPTQDTILYRSEDGGVTWPVTVTLPNAQVVSMAASTTAPNVIYAGAGFGPFSWGRAVVFRSEDGGLTWSEVTDNGTHLAFAAPSTVYTVMDSGGAWMSTANGDPGTWMEIGGIWDTAMDMALDANAAPAQLYVGGQLRGVFAGSDDGGFAWNLANNGIETAVTPSDIDLDPADDDGLYVVGDCVGGWQSPDGGATWTQMGDACWHGLDVDESNADVIFAGRSDCSQGTLLRSDDGGLSFTPVYTPAYFQPDCSGGDGSIHTVAMAPAASSTVYGAGSQNPNWMGQGALVVSSSDGGASWTEVFTMGAESRALVLAVDPMDDQVAYVGGENCSGGPCTGFVYGTVNGGGTWSPMLVTSNTVSSIVIDYTDPSVLYVADRDYRVQKSVDGGATWSVLLQPPWISNEPSGYLLVMDPHVHEHLYLAGWGYVAESGDGGLTWSPWDAPINNGTPPSEPQALAVDMDTNVQTLYAGFEGVWAYSHYAPVTGPRYVATTGSDTNNGCGDPAAPCATIAHAIDVASSGESIWIAAGTYDEWELEINGKTLTLRGGYEVDGSAWTPGGGETIVDGNAMDRVFHIFGNDSTLEDLTITGGDTPDDQCWGGGIWVTNGDVTLRRLLIHDNWADCSGAGVEVNSDFGPAHANLIDTIVMNNASGGEAGGVSVWHTAAHLTNTVIMSNTGAGGSALRIEDSDVSVVNSTITANSGGPAVNVYNTAGPPEPMVMVNSIVWGNGPTSIDCSVPTCSVTYSDVEGGHAGAGNVNVDPLFAGFLDFHLSPDSTLIDAGTNSGAPDHDIDGEVRPYGATVDIGADEWWPTFVFMSFVAH